MKVSKGDRIRVDVFDGDQRVELEVDHSDDRLGQFSARSDDGTMVLMGEYRDLDGRNPEMVET